MIISGIYKIQSVIKPERIYIGSAVNIQRRWNGHRKSLKDNNHHSSKLQNHYNKYGKEDLVYTIILSCELHDLISKEQFFIDSYNPYFNICPLAGSQLGTKRSDDFKQKQRENRMGHEVTEETKQKMKHPKGIYIKTDKWKPSYGNQGKCHSEEARRKIKEKRNQRLLISEITRNKMKKSQKKRWLKKHLLCA